VAVAHRVGGRLFVPAAESGHTGLPHGDARLNALTDHLAQTHPHKPIEAALKDLERAIRLEHADTDPSLKFAIEPGPSVSEAVGADDSLRLVKLLMALPDGVQAMSLQIEGLVETSCNLASVTLDSKGAKIVTSQRSSVMSRLEDITRRIEAAAALTGAFAQRLNGYPAWEPDLESPLLARCSRVYRSLFGSEPTVEAVHAGLECAVIGDKYEGMDMISFGPTIEDPHSPDEALDLASVEKVWAFVKALLRSFVEDGKQIRENRK
jgi:dipeptidase D